jgi:DNA damage-binding protein 1
MCTPLLLPTGCQRPTLAILYEDSRHARHVKAYEVQLKDKVLRGAWGADVLVF